MLYKHPRIYHLPWSPGITTDDKVLKDIPFIGKNVCMSIKMDGENSSLYCDYIHARSIDSKDHKSRHWLKALWSKIKWAIPEEWRICGENLYAQHSIYYDNLESYFMVFSVWNDKNYCLSYNDTETFCKSLGLVHVPIIYNGPWNEVVVKEKFKRFSKLEEGYVIRNSDSFHYDDFSYNVAKFVRAGHVQTDEHWMQKPVTCNKLKNTNIK